MKKALIPVVLVLICILCSNPADTTIQWNDPDSKIPLRESYSIYLTGKIMDESGKPLAGAIVGLNTRKLVDTTGTDGIYTLIETKKSGSSGGLEKIEVDSISDSILVYREGQIVTSMLVSDLIDSLPDIFIVQRDIYGKLTSAGPSVKIISVNLREKGGADSVSRMIDLWFNKENSSYSGFIYFTYSVTPKEYDVIVYVMNIDSVITGTSKLITFPASAGDIEIPEFSCTSASPAVNLCLDTTIKIKDTITLHAAGIDLPYGIRNYIWALDGVHFADTTDSGSIDVSFVTPGDHTVLVKIVSTKGYSKIYSMKINVDPMRPVVNCLTDTSIDFLDTITLRASANDNGEIEKYIWAVDGRNYSDTTSVGDLITNFPALKVRYTASRYAYLDSLTGKRFTDLNVLVKAIDDDGFVSLPDTCHVKVSLVLPSITMSTDTVIGINDTIILHASATDLRGSIDKYIWALDGVHFNDTTVSGSIRYVSPFTQGRRYVLLKVTNSRGFFSDTDSLKIDVVAKSPVITYSIDTSIIMFDTATLRVSATDDGTIEKYIWAVDGKNYTDTTAVGILKTTFPALKVRYTSSGYAYLDSLKPGVPDVDKNYNRFINLTVPVKVIDEDGLVSLPVNCRVKVTLLFPFVSLSGPETANLGDTLVFRAIPDQPTRVKGYIWARDGKNFTDTTMHDTIILVAKTTSLIFGVQYFTREGLYSKPLIGGVSVYDKDANRSYVKIPDTVNAFIRNLIEVNVVETGREMIRYVWSVDGNGFTDTTIDGRYPMMYDNIGSHVLIVEGIDVFGNISKPDTCTVIVRGEVPKITMLTPDTAADFFDTLTLRASGVGEDSITRFVWGFSGVSVFRVSEERDGNISSVRVKFSSEGNLVAKVRGANKDNIFSDVAVCTVSVRKNPPVVNVLVSDTTVNIKDTITIKAIAIGDISQFAYYWNVTGSAKSTGVNYRDSIKIGFFKQGQAIVTCTMTDKNNLKSVPDTCFINVVSTPPNVTVLTPDTIVDIIDTVIFSASAVDNDSIVRFSWTVAGLSPYTIMTPKRDNNICEAGISMKTAGNAYVICTAFDTDGESASDTCLVTVALNPPTVDILTQDTTVNVYDTLRLSVSGTDNDSVVWFSWGGANPISGYSDRFVFTYAGKYYVTCIAYDNHNNKSLPDTCIVNVVSNPPIVSMITPDTTVDIIDTVIFRASAFDNERVSQYDWTITGFNSYKTVQKIEDNICQIGISFRTEGTGYVLCRATDNDGEFAYDTCKVTVELNRPNVNVLTRDTTVNVYDTLRLSVSGTDNDSVVWFLWGGANSIPGYSDRFVFTSAGKYYITCIAYDNHNNKSLPDTCIVNVVSSPPIVSMITPDTTVDINDTITFRALGTDNRSVVKYSWGRFDSTGAVFNSVVVRNENGEADISFRTEGKVNVLVRAEDNNHEYSNIDTCIVTVEKNPPVLTIVSSDTTVNIFDTVTIRCRATDNGPVYRYNWQVNGSYVISPGGISDSIIRIKFSQYGPQLVTCYAYDNDNLVSDTDSCIVTVTGNRPIVTMLKKDTTVDINDYFEFSALATDNEVVMGYIWSKSEGPVYSSSSRTIDRFGFSFQNVGVAYVMVVAVDNDGEFSLPDTCVVTVTKQVPTVTMLKPDTTVTVNDSVTFRASSADNGTVHYNWNSNVNTYTGEFKTAFTATGEKYVIVRAIDEDNLISEPDTCKVMVVDP